MARLSDCAQKHGAIVISGGRTLAVGVNMYRNAPDMFGIGDCYFSVHAEVSALKSIPKSINLKNATLYVARISKGGNVAYSAPCKECQKYIKARKIRKICYTINKEMTL